MITDLPPISFNSFSLTEHVDKGFTAQQSAESFADYFSAISQQYIPLNVNSLEERVKVKLQAPIIVGDLTVVEAWQVRKS